MRIATPKDNGNIDERIIKYIKNIKLKPRMFGADTKDLWTIISNVQKYYDEKMYTQKVEYEANLKRKDEEIAYLRNMIQGGQR